MRSTPRRVDGRFANPWPTAEPEALPGEAPPDATPREGELRDFLAWRFGRASRARRRAARRPGWAPPRAKPAVLEAGDARTALTWVGHSTWLLQVDGRAFLTDPAFGDALVVPRLSPPAFRVEAVPRLDALLVSHDHSTTSTAAPWSACRATCPSSAGSGSTRGSAASASPTCAA